MLFFPKLSMHLERHSWQIFYESVFLEGKEIDMTILVIHPVEFNTDIILI